MKKKNGLLWGVIALVVLCIIYVGVGQYMEHSEKTQKEVKEAERVYMTDITSVTGVSYDYEGTALSFTKEGDTWKYDRDDQFPVEESKITGIVSTASKLEAVRKLEGGDDLSAYGLAEPARKVTLTAEDGSHTVICIGNSTEDSQYYAMIEGPNIPYLIGAALFTETSGGLDELMALDQFPSIQGTDIKELSITKEGSTERYIKKILEGDAGTVEWYQDSIDSPEQKIEDNSALNVLADSISSLTVDSCANYKVTEEELAGYGLESPSTVIAYVYDDNGADQTLTLSVGTLNEDESCYYTRMNDSGHINEIDKASIDKCLTIDSGVNAK